MPLPDFPATETEAPADVVVKYGKVEPLEPVTRGTELCIQFKGDEAYFFYNKLGTCRVSRGREIVGEPSGNIDESELGLLVQGPGISVLLHQRGYVTLHASCVATDLGAMAFVGQSGSGKSVIAAALHLAGYGLVTDDVTVVDPDHHSPTVYPGYPSCHLLPDAVAYFGENAVKPDDTCARPEKITCSAHQGFSIQPMGLRRVYILEDGPEVRVEPVSGHKAVFELVRHSYWIRFVHDARPSSYFFQCGQLCEKVPVRALFRPKSMDMLPEVLTVLEKDLRVE